MQVLCAAAAVALAVAASGQGEVQTAKPKVVVSAGMRVLEPIITSETYGADSVLSAPQLPIRLHLDVRAEVRFDSTARAWIYLYRVHRAPGDSLLDEFAIAPVPKTARLLAPRGWKAFEGWEERDNAAVWTPWVETPLGDTSDSLVIVCPAPPTNVRFYAAPFRSELPEGEDDESVPPTLFNSGVTGIIAGPDTTNGAETRPGARSAPALVLHARSMAPIGEARIRYALRHPATISIDVCDSTAKRVRSLLRLRRDQTGAVLWNGLDDSCRPVPPGDYSFKLTVDGQPAGSARVRVPSGSSKVR
jgi:hypothetical protein